MSRAIKRVAVALLILIIGAIMVTLIAVSVFIKHPGVFI